MTFIDDFSRHTKIFPTRQKSEVFSRFQKFKYEVKKTTDRHIRCLPSDGGKEYFSDAFTTYLQQEGVRQEFTCRLTLSPIHVVWWRCYQFSFVDLDIENILSIIIIRYEYILVDSYLYIFFLYSLYHHPHQYCCWFQRGLWVYRLFPCCGCVRLFLGRCF